MKLKDKIAVVTGAGQGIGKETALELAREGAKVAVNDVVQETIEKVVAEIKAQGQEAIGIRADVSKREEVEQAVNQVLTQWGRVDILANVAGIYPIVSLVEMTEEQWDRVLDVNLKGIFNCIKAALPAMIAQKGGSIVNVASLAGAVGGEPMGALGHVHYAASKGGVLGFTRSAAQELGQHGIRVNAIAPGGVVTEGTMAISKSLGFADFSEEMLAEAAKAHIEMVPLKRMGQTIDMAKTILFLASDDSSFITGQLIVVDGGITLS
ncbi:SDR family NAD(P)-dependent oxidoreductase [Chloroflexota bacterium]